MVQFPSFVSKTMDEEERKFPDLFKEQHLTVVQIAFRREHAKTADAWSRALKFVRDKLRNPNLIQVVLVMGDVNSVLKWALRKVFSSKFTRKQQREVRNIFDAH